MKPPCRWLRRGPGSALPVAVALLLGSVLAGGGARAADPTPQMSVEAREHYDLGMARFRARGFSEAIRSFEAAFALDPRREILFALAQATRLSGDCAAAVPLYQRFLATRPPARQVEATRIALARCEEPSPVPMEAAISAPSEPRPAAPLAPADGPPPRATSAPSSRPVARLWHRDPAAGALAAAGALSLGAGLGLVYASRLADRDHRNAVSYDRAQERRAAAQSRQRWATAALLSATTLALGAGARWLWLRWSAGSGSERRAQVRAGVGERF